MSASPASWDAALARLGQEDPIALYVFSAFALLAPQAIPQQLIDLAVEVISVHLQADELRQKSPGMSEAEIMNTLNAGENPDSAKIVRTLQQASLVTVANGAMSVSFGAQAVAINRVPDGRKAGLAGVVLYILNDAWPEDPRVSSTWSECAELMPHADVAVMHAQRLGAEQGGIIALLRKVDAYLRARAESGLRSGNPEAAKEYAGYLFAHGVFGGAAENFERVVQLTEQRQGLQSSDLVDPLLELAAAQLQAGQLTEARRHGLRACMLAEDCYGRNDARTALAMSAQARILREAKQLEHAERFMRGALDIGLSTLGRRHPQVATYANSLAQILQDQGDLEGAEGAYKLAIEIDSAHHGPEHIEVANSLNDLASCFEEGHKYSEAQEAIDRTVHIFTRNFPADHPVLVRAQDRQQRVYGALRLLPPQ